MLKIFSLLALLSVLSACGQKGALYLAEKNPSQRALFESDSSVDSSKTYQSDESENHINDY